MRRRRQSLKFFHGQFTRSLLLAVCIQLLFSGSCLAAGPTLDWIRQFGTLDDDIVSGLSLDGLGNLYLSGDTGGSLGGPNAGNRDEYTAKYSIDSNQVWLHQFGTSGLDRSFGIAADGLGNVFQSGGPGGDFLISNRDGNGTELWSREPVGTAASGVSANGLGHAYFAGTIGRPEPSDDSILEKFDAAGNQLWFRQFGTTDHEQSNLVSADSAGNVFVYGHNICDSGCEQSAILTKFDGEGNEYWTRKVQSSQTVRRGGVFADGLGNVYVSGSSFAPIFQPRVHPGYDAFVAKYDAQGNYLWLQEFGTAEFSDSANSVAVDGLGNVFVTGTMGDPYLAMFDVNGNELWLHKFGTPAADSGSLVTTDGLGNVYVAGTTQGDLGGPNAGSNDVFLAKFSVGVPQSGDFDGDGDVDGRDFLAWQRIFSFGNLANWRANYGTGSLVAANVAVPEPSTLLLLMLATAGGWVSRRID